MKFSLFCARDLQSHKTCTVLDKFQVNYLAFNPENQKDQNKAPLVILGGAFQKFHSFKKEVDKLCENFPVILVDLPGQGSNDQETEGLTFEDYADILAAFTEYMDLEKITPIAFSYGSAIGYCFAGKYPEKTHRLILGGTTPKLRDSVKILLEESLVAMKENRMDDFSTGVILNLFNYSQRKRTKIPRLLIRGFYKSLLNLSEKDKSRYLANTQRLLTLKGLEGPRPQCETLVLAGEFDNFTTPTECLAVANQCLKPTVCILKNCDHLAPFVKKDLMISIYGEFAETGKCAPHVDVEVYNEKEIPLERQILEPRWSYAGPALLKCPKTGWKQDVEILNLNSYGLRINLKGNHLNSEAMKNLTLELPKEGLTLETIFFHRELDDHRGVFKRYNFDTYEKVEKFIKSLGDGAQVFRPAQF